MSKRDTILTLLALGTAPLLARAQTSRKVSRIALLSPNSAALSAPRWDVLRKGLREAGYTEGRDIIFEIRNANGNYEHMDRGAGEVVSLNVDVIVATSTYAARAAQKATANIPIVFVNVSDPIAAGFANTLARPGANMTGVSIITGELNRKRLELLKLAIPHLSHIAWLVNPNNPYIAAQVPQMHSAAGGIGVKLVVANWNAVDDFDAVLSKLTGDRAKAITLSADPLYTDHVRDC